MILICKPTSKRLAANPKKIRVERINMAKKALNTIGTVLKFGASAEAAEKLCPIKSYPALLGTPDQLETTDLEDSMQTFEPGVQTVDNMEFTFNLTAENFKKVSDTAMTEGFYELAFPGFGSATWQGKHSVSINEGEVNGIREGTITVFPSTEIKVTPSTT